MYRVCVSKNFIAQHFLIGGDWGSENQLHSHAYRIDLELAGSSLDPHFYLVDIVAVEAALKQATNLYQDQTLNEMPGFEGVNPSLEHFARLLCEFFDRELKITGIQKIIVRLWENEIAWASFEMDR